MCDEAQVRRRARLPQFAPRGATSWGTLNILGGGPRFFLATLSSSALTATTSSGPGPACRDVRAALDDVTAALREYVNTWPLQVLPRLVM